MNKPNRKDIIIFYVIVAGLLINNFFENYCAYEENKMSCRDFVILNQNDPPQPASTHPDMSQNDMVVSGTTASTVSTSEIFHFQDVLGNV
jgi:hypothetical protein